MTPRTLVAAFLALNGAWAQAQTTAPAAAPQAPDTMAPMLGRNASRPVSTQNTSATSQIREPLARAICTQAPGHAGNGSCRCACRYVEYRPATASKRNDNTSAATEPRMYSP